MSRKRKQLHKRHKAEVTGRVQELMAEGWSRQDADHLCVIELALDVVPTLSPPGRRVLAGHVTTALSWAPVRLATPTLYGSEAHAEAWRALSAVADPPFDRFMAELAAVDRDIVPATDMTLELLHPDNVRHVLDCSRAEARGDFKGAIASLKQAIRPLHDTWLAELELMQRQGAELTPAQWGRWMCGAALRWGENTEYGLETGIRLAELVLLTLGAPAERLADWTPTRLAWDTVIHDALLFDHGLLDHWLSHQVAPRLLENAPGVGSWVLAQPTIVELAGADGTDALVRDLRSERDVVVGDRGLAADHPAGRMFYGRLVQVEDDERSWFATLPTIIESPDVAEAVLQVSDAGGDDEARLRAFYLPLRQVVAPDDPEEDHGQHAREAS